MQYHSYHTYIKCLYVTGKLAPAFAKQIPKSTRSNWMNHYDFSKVFGLNIEKEFDQRMEVAMAVSADSFLYPFNKAVLKAGKIFKTFLTSLKEKKELLKEHSKQIMDVIENLPVKWKKVKVLSRFGISKQQYDYLKRTSRKCTSSIRSLCFSRHPHQLTENTVRIIRKYCCMENLFLWPGRSIYYKILRDGKAFFSVSTFYNYRRWLGLSKKRKKYKKKYEPLRAKRPFEKLHMDVTIMRLADHTKAYIYMLVDNFSKALLNFKVSREFKASISLRNLREAIDKYGLIQKAEQMELIVDDGSENKGEVDEFIASSECNIKKLIAQIDIVQSNSMVEAANSVMKHQYLYSKDFQTIEQLEERIKFFQDDFGNRPHGELYGITPYEALLLKETPDKNRFKTQIAQARKERIAENQKFDCKKCMDLPQTESSEIEQPIEIK